MSQTPVVLAGNIRASPALMSMGSPAYSFGWWKYPGSTYGYKWDLSHGTFMQAPSTLNATNTWDKTWEANDDY